MRMRMMMRMSMGMRMRMMMMMMRIMMRTRMMMRMRMRIGVNEANVITMIRIILEVERQHVGGYGTSDSYGVEGLREYGAL